MPKVYVTSANASTLDIQQNFPNFQVSALLYLRQTRLRFRNPQIMRWVGINADIRFGRLDLCHGSRAHLVLVDLVGTAR